MSGGLTPCRQLRPSSRREHEKVERIYGKDWGFQLEQDHIIYDIDIYREYSVAWNMQTGEQYAVYLTSSMKPTGPGGH